MAVSGSAWQQAGHGEYGHGVSMATVSIAGGLRDVALELWPLAPRLVEGLHAAGELEAVVHVHVQKGRELH